MDYRMYSGGAPANENVIPIIIKELNDNGMKVSGPLKFIAFEGSAGTTFYLNNHKELTKIPSTGKFITPYTGERFMPIYSLKFPDGFVRNIYYII